VAEIKEKKSQSSKRRRFSRSKGVKERRETPSPLINEPLVKCELCENVIENIAEAISEGSAKFSHFDCVIEKISKKEKLAENQKISYIGRGIFAVVELSEENRYKIVKEITYESPQDFSKMKQFVEELKK